MRRLRGWGDSARVGALLASFFAANAVSTAYLPLWLADHGLDAGRIGTVLGVASLARVIGVPVLGWVADRTGRHRAAMMLGAIVAGLCAALLPDVAGTDAVAILVIAGGVASASLAPLADAITLALAAAGRADYGRTRAWGSVAYMVATASGGALLGRFGSGIAPWLLVAGFGLASVLALALPRIAAVPRHLTSGHLGPAFRATVVATALIQGSHAAYYAFASLHWRSAGISDGVIGLLIAEGIVAEVALFVWGRRMVEWLGPAQLTRLAAGACIVRWTATAFVVSVPALAAIQLLHAVTFAFQHLSSMAVLRGLPPGRAGTAQGVLAALGFSAPTGVLIWISGALYGRYDGLVFLLMAALGGMALLVARSLPDGAHRR